jgi:general secretion pathway protein G
MITIARPVIVTIALSFVVGCSSRTEELRKKESILREDLYSMRQAIDQYTQDRNKAPASLDDLVRAGYLNEIPIDPITRSRLWKMIQEDIDDRVHPPTPAITDSGSNQVSSQATHYSDW